MTDSSTPDKTISCIKRGRQAKGIWEQDPEEDIGAQKEYRDNFT